MGNQIQDAVVNVVQGVSKKGTDYYRMEVTVAGKYHFSSFLNSDQVSILRLLGYIQ